jgi:hypothetical protein
MRFARHEEFEARANSVEGDVNEFTPEQEQFITEVVNSLGRRYAGLLERLATEVHALAMVLVNKRVITIEELETARRQLDLAFEITQARELRAIVSDLDRLGRDLGDGRDFDEGDARSA